MHLGVFCFVFATQPYVFTNHPHLFFLLPRSNPISFSSPELVLQPQSAAVVSVFGDAATDLHEPSVDAIDQPLRPAARGKPPPHAAMLQPLTKKLQP